MLGIAYNTNVHGLTILTFLFTNTLVKISDQRTIEKCTTIHRKGDLKKKKKEKTILSQ